MLALFWLPFVIKTLIVMAISTGISLLLAKRPKSQKPAGKEDFDLPTAEEGRPYPVLWGRRWIQSPNAISPIIYFYAKKKTIDNLISKTTKCYQYFVGIHWGLCHAHIDGVRQIRVTETVVWPVVNDRTSLAANGQTSFAIHATECWGGRDREGGINGTIHVQYGGAEQTLDSYVESRVGSDKPAYRDITGVIWARVYIGTVPVIKPWAYLCERTSKLTTGDNMWYSAKAAVGSNGDLNAIHILYELFTSPIVGLGKDTSLIGDTWTTAADTCYTEGYGLSCLWDSAPDDLESMVEEIEKIIDGKVYQDPTTGKFEIGLVRDDYTAGDLEEYDEDDFWVENMPVSSAGSVANKVIVLWHDRMTMKSRPAFADDIALLAREDGNPIQIEMDYSNFVCSPTLATKIASREQDQLSALPKRLTLHALRTMAHLHETSVIKISYPELNITSMIVRVMTIDRGALDEGECILDVVEDVYGQPYTIYGTPPDAGEENVAEEVEEQPTDAVQTAIYYSTTHTETLRGSAEDSVTVTDDASASVT